MSAERGRRLLRGSYWLLAVGWVIWVSGVVAFIAGADVAKTLWLLSVAPFLASAAVSFMVSREVSR